MTSKGTLCIVTLVAACGAPPTSSSLGTEADAGNDGRASLTDAADSGLADLQERPPYDSRVASLVDPFIGTAGEGNTFPGAAAPWAMVSISPHTNYTSPLDFLANGDITPAGYVDGALQIFGFGLTQLSGVGCPDLGAPTVMAVAGDGADHPDDHLLRSRASSYSQQVAWPGYYGVRLDDHGVLVEATVGARVGVLRVRFVGGGSSGRVLIDAGRSLSWRSAESWIRVVSSTEVEGYSATGLFCGEANKQRVYFVARLDRRADDIGTWSGKARSTDERQRRGTDVGAFLTLDLTGKRTVELQVGISLVSVEGARANLEHELGPPSALTGSSSRFEQVRAATFERWERALSTILVEGGSAEQRTIFYSALYRALLHPSLASDATGEYLLMRDAGAAAVAGRLPDGQERYTVFSLWDTYRTVHPLLTLLYPTQQLKLLRSLATMTVEHGRAPLWELVGQEVNMMNGDPALPMVADSYLKGLTDFDIDRLYAAMRDAALDPDDPERPGNAAYRELGFVPMDDDDDVWGAASTTLEYALADWALSRLAAALGEAQDAAFFAEASIGYRQLFDPSSGFLRPRYRDGRFHEPFDPLTIEGSRGTPRSGGPGYVEGNAWHYAFFAPHDIDGLIALYGGEARLTDRLQQLFDEDHYTLWNEPDIGFPYLFNHLAGQSWRCQREVDQARRRFFSAKTDGLAGNDDAGTLSAWYVLSAIGLYPDLPGAPRYALTSPLFERVELRLDPAFYPGGRTFVIEAPRPQSGAIYVTEMTLDGQRHEGFWIEHQRLVAGGTLRMTLAKTPQSR